LKNIIKLNYLLMEGDTKFVEKFDGLRLPRSIFRSAFLFLFAWATTLHAATPLLPGQVASGSQLKPGEFTWHPETSPRGPILIIVSIPEQKAYVYRNGVIIARTTISSGRKWHETPTGVFTVLQKQRDHTSSIFKGAKMPNMERLTWSGIALHAGNLPGHPDSHGCVRFPLAFSRQLYSVTSVGTTVVIADDASDSASVAHPGSLMAKPAIVNNVRFQKLPLLGYTWNPGGTPKGPVSIVVSGSDKQVFVFQNGALLGRAQFEFVRRSGNLHSCVFSFLGTDAGKKCWLGVGLDEATSRRNLKILRDRVVISPEFLAKVDQALHPGATLVITPRSVLPPSLDEGPMESFYVLDLIHVPHRQPTSNQSRWGL
jgi:hypothetical protein